MSKTVEDIDFLFYLKHGNWDGVFYDYDDIIRDIQLENEFGESDLEQEEIEKDIEKQLGIDKIKKKLEF